jgi:hypothetical protein
MPGTGLTYDTATNTFRPKRLGATGGLQLPYRVDRPERAGGFSRQMTAAPARPVKLPRATNTPKGAKRNPNLQPYLPPE